MASSTAALNNPPSKPPLWQRFAYAFEHRYDTVSAEELLTKRDQFDATEEEVVQVIEWALDRQLVEVLEGERLGLTPQGRRLWRELMGEV